MTESNFREDAYPELPCVRCGYTGKVTVTSIDVTVVGDEEVKMHPLLVRCSFCGAEYDPSLQEAPPLPDNYTPPQNPPPMKR